MENQRRSNKILVTGFEPFHGMAINPSAKIVTDLDGMATRNFTVKGALLPVDCETMPVRLYNLLETEQPAAIISFGLAAGRNAIALERVGLNLMNWSKPDNGGHLRTDAPVIKDGAPAYFATLPLREIESACREAAVPCYLSETAGLFLCNQTLYLITHYAVNNSGKMLAGFIHVPAIPEMVEDESAGRQPTMAYSLILAAARLAVEVTAQKLAA